MLGSPQNTCQTARPISLHQEVLASYPAGCQAKIGSTCDQKTLRKESRRMRESRATAVGAMRRQNAAELAPRSRRVPGVRAGFAQNSPCAFSKACSSHWTSRIRPNPLKINDRGTLYSSQIREALFSRQRRIRRLQSSSPESTSRGFLSGKELECTHQSESLTWKSEGGFSWQLILL